jgi:hypothetical protein
MWPIKYFEKIRRMDDLIHKKATGTPNEFSRKMNLSRRALMCYLQAMKFLGFPIKYDKNRRCYYYRDEGRMTKDFFVPSKGNELSKEDQKAINGGISHILEWCSNNASWDNTFTEAYTHYPELSLGVAQNLKKRVG